MSNERDTHFGTADLAAMSEFLLRGYSVALPYVDKGLLREHAASPRQANFGTVGRGSGATAATARNCARQALFRAPARRPADSSPWIPGPPAPHGV